MKKAWIILMILAVLMLFISCEKDVKDDEQQPQDDQSEESGLDSIFPGEDNPIVLPPDTFE